MVKCKAEKCTIKNACFGLKTDDKPSFCKKHSTKFMIDLIHIKCKCGKHRPNFGLEIDKKIICCKKCKTPEMVDLTHKLCLCGKAQPQFGLKNDKNATCCSKCKTDIMINIVSKKCKCGKTVPHFGLEHNKTPSCCKECKTDNMFNIVDKKCKCGKHQPSFGYKSDNIRICCKKCKTLNMSIIFVKKCKCGKTDSPCFGLINDSNATCCNKCKTNEMIDIKNKKCKCGKRRPCFGLKTDKSANYCKMCKNKDMVNIVDKKCLFEDCDTLISNKNYDGYCVYHFSNLYPDKPISKNYRTKERKVVDYIKEYYPLYKWKFDNIIKGGISYKRPDIFLDLGNKIIIIEVDENQHNKYETICENRRIVEIYLDINPEIRKYTTDLNEYIINDCSIKTKSVIFIKFNPDKYIDQNNNKISSCFVIEKKTGLVKINNKMWNERLNILKQTVDKWLKNDTTKTIEVCKLFYDK